MLRAKTAQHKGCHWGVVTFDPHPRNFFAAEKQLSPLTPTQEKSALAASLGASYHVVLSFDEELSSMSAQEFIDLVLEQKLRVSGVVTGLDFRFGRKRSGDITTLSQWANRGGYHSESVTPLILPGDVEPVSSTRIRTALSAGDTASAQLLLGRAYCVCGTILLGEQRGRTIGFPTINFGLDDWFIPKFGVYAVRVSIAGHGDSMRAVANIGVRPTVGGTKPLLEAHIFGFSADVYGCAAKISIGPFIRGEQKFHNLDALRDRIRQDCETAKLLAEQFDPGELDHVNQRVIPVNTKMI